MKRYLIKEAKCNLTKGGMACGPVFPSIVVTIHFNDGTEDKYLSVVETDGFPTVYLFDEDYHDRIVKEDFSDEAFNDFLDGHIIDTLNRIVIDYDYDGTFESMSEDPKNPAVPLLRYMIALVRCKMEDVDNIIKMGSGKYADTLDIPVSDIEEMYLEDKEYEEDDDDQ